MDFKKTRLKVLTEMYKSAIMAEIGLEEEIAIKEGLVIGVVRPDLQEAVEKIKKSIEQKKASLEVHREGMKRLEQKIEAAESGRQTSSVATIS